MVAAGKAEVGRVTDRRSAMPEPAADRPASAELGALDMLLFAKSSEEVERLRRKAAQIPGVAKAEAWLFNGFFDHSAWLDDAITARAQARNQEA